MTKITESRSSDKRGYVVSLSVEDVEFAHYVLTYKGFARGGSSYPYDKDVTVCFGNLLCIGLPTFDTAQKYQMGKIFTIPLNMPTLAVALDDTFTFTNHRGVGDEKPNEALQIIKNRINSGENLEFLLKEFGIVQS